MTPDELDALIERLNISRAAYARAAERDHDMQIGNTDVSLQSEMFAQAAAALVQLRKENARLTKDAEVRDTYLWVAQDGQRRAEAEAERLEQAILDQAELNRRRITALSDAEALARGKIAEQMIEIARLTKLKAECWSNPEAWMKWCDIRVLERAEDANKDRNAAVTQWTVEKLKCERAEAEVARIRQMLDTAMELLTAARGTHD